MRVSGIYQIQSKLKPERIYIGSACDIHSRWSKHLLALKRNKHENSKLQRHYNKYGKNDLEFSILIGCAKDDLISTEQFYLDSHNTYFNIRKIADSNIGIKTHPHTEAAKEKMRKANLGKEPWNKGKKGVYSEETLKMMGTGRKNKTTSEETKKKMSEKHKELGSGKRLPNFKGTHYSEERKQQCRDVWVKRKLNKVCEN